MVIKGEGEGQLVVDICQLVKQQDIRWYHTRPQSKQIDIHTTKVAAKVWIQLWKVLVSRSRTVQNRVLISNETNQEQMKRSDTRYAYMGRRRSGHIRELGYVKVVMMCKCTMFFLSRDCKRCDMASGEKSRREKVCAYAIPNMLQKFSKILCDTVLSQQCIRHSKKQ